MLQLFLLESLEIQFLLMPGPADIPVNVTGGCHRRFDASNKIARRADVGRQHRTSPVAPTTITAVVGRTAVATSQFSWRLDRRWWTGEQRISTKAALYGFVFI